MSKPGNMALIILSTVLLAAWPMLSQAGDRASRILKKQDQNGDGNISRQEWTRSGSRFRQIDTDGDKAITLDELRTVFGGGGEKRRDKNNKDSSARNEGDDPKLTAIMTGREGEAEIGAISLTDLCAMSRGERCGNKDAIAYGLIATGLVARFPDNAKCRKIDDYYSMDYTHKRNRESFHGGADIPAPYGTPMIAAATGTVVARYGADNSKRGIEIVLRHSPQDTGLPYWLYTAYGHFDKIPKLKIGQRVRLGEALGPTGNTGIAGRGGGQSSRRRPAIHFAVFYTQSEKFVEVTKRETIFLIPVGFRWMDPIALHRTIEPRDSVSLKALPEAEKAVPVAVMFKDGKTKPVNAKVIWPYTCERR